MRKPSGATASAAFVCSKTSWYAQVWILKTRYPCPAARWISAAKCSGEAGRVQAATGTQSRRFGPISFQAGTSRHLPIRS